MCQFGQMLVKPSDFFALELFLVGFGRMSHSKGRTPTAAPINYFTLAAFGFEGSLLGQHWMPWTIGS